MSISSSILMKTPSEVVQLFLLTCAMAIGSFLVGCDRKETVIDINTPDGGVEVERDKDTGEITVDVEE